MKRVRKYKPYSARRLEKKSKRKLFLTFIIGAVLFYSLITWFIPNLIGSLSIINTIKPTVKETAIPVSEDTTLAPPVFIIPFEATNSSTILVSGYASSQAKVEVYVDNELKDTINTEENGNFTAKNIPLTLGSNTIYGKTVDQNGKKSLPSKGIKVDYKNEKPELSIKEPSDNQTIQGGDKKVTISGSVSPIDNMTVVINTTRAIVSKDGNFSQTIEINEGENNITITATDNAGNSTQKSLKITYQP